MQLAIGLTRVLFPMVFLLGLSGIVVGILNSYDEFTVPALTPVFWNLAIIVGLVLGVPNAHTMNGKLYVYAFSILIGTVIQVLLPLPWLFAPRRPPPRRARLARPDGAAGLRADDPRHPRARPDQLQRGRRHALRLAAARSGARADGDRQGVPRLHAPAGDLLRRDRHRAVPDAVAARGPRRLGRLPRHGRARAAADGLPPDPGERDGRRARDADRAAALPARRVHARADDRRRRRARRVLARPHVQRRDADAEPRVLQPAGELDSDGRRAREPRRSTRCSTGRSTGSASGGSRSPPRS